MNRRADHDDRVYIRPGELHVTDVPTQITTLVGSCLAITFYVKRLSLAGMCHSVLPSPARPVGGDEVGKYVTTGVMFILEMMRSIGATTKEIEVKAFGGGAVIGLAGNSGLPMVGEQNIAAFLDLVERDSLNLLAHDLGGSRGRRVVFDTATGDVFMRRMSARDTGTTPAPHHGRRRDR